jgi:cell division protein FtsB
MVGGGLRFHAHVIVNDAFSLEKALLFLLYFIYNYKNKCSVTKMKILIVILSIIFTALQYRIWFGGSTHFVVAEVKNQIQEQADINDTLIKRNSRLKAEVVDLKHGVAVIEERARGQFGMIQQGEVFFQVVKHR